MPTLEDAVIGHYKNTYYQSYHNRALPGNEPDLRVGPGQVRSQISSNNPVVRAVAKAYFEIWSDISAEAVDLVNALVVDPDGNSNNGNEWNSGWLVPTRKASHVFSPR